MFILHSGDMSCPPVMVLRWHVLNSGYLGLLMNFNICDKITPMIVEDGEGPLGDVCDCCR